MATLLTIVWYALAIYKYVLLARIILDLVMAFSRDWRPSGAVLVLANAIYALTDPPLHWLRRIPPIRLGAVALDLGFIVLFIGVTICQIIISQIIVSIG